MSSGYDLQQTDMVQLQVSMSSGYDLQQTDMAQLQVSMSSGYLYVEWL